MRWPHFPNDNAIIRECEINGEMVRYDACASNKLSEAKEFYKDYKYIGSSHKYYINGTLNEPEKLHHFFVKDSK